MSGGKHSASARKHLNLNLTLNLIAFEFNGDNYDAVVNDVWWQAKRTQPFRFKFEFNCI